MDRPIRRVRHIWVAMSLLLALASTTGCGTLHALGTRIAYPPEGKYFKYDGLKIHYVTGGPGPAETGPADRDYARPTIIFVHGDFGSTRDLTMSPLWPALCAKYSVVAFDRPGYGYSSRPYWRSMSSADHAEVLHEVVRRFGGKKPIIVGHSRGARIALDYACKYGDEAGAVVLLGLPPEFPAQDGQGKRPLEYSLAAIPVLGELYTQTLVAPIGSWAGLGRWYLSEAFKPHAAGGREEDLPPRYARACVALALRPGECRANEIDAARAYTPVGPLVAGIRAPVYLVHGYLDNICPWLAPAIMHCEGWFAQSHMTLIADAAHQPHWTHPDVVARVIFAAVSAAGSQSDAVIDPAVAAARQRTHKLEGALRTYVRVQGMEYVNAGGLTPAPEPPWTPPDQGK